MAKYTSVAPMAMNRAIKPRAMGRFSVMTGMRPPWTALAGLEDLLELVRSVPQTRQRGASSLNRVPQVGHNFVGFDGISELIE